jgi:TonB family protein
VKKSVVTTLLLFSFLFAVAPVLLFATVSDTDLQKEYGDKVLTLRQFCPGSHLHFDSTGKLAGNAGPGAWTTDGMLRVEKMSIINGALHIRGQRIFLIYDRATKQMRDVRAFEKATWVRDHSKVDVEIDAGEAQPEMADIAKLMNLVFLSTDEKLMDAVPEYWKDWLKKGEGYKPPVANVANAKAPSETDPAKTTAKVGGSISAPRATYTPDPQYSDAADHSGYQGTCVLWLVVGTDGLAHDIRIVRALGLGLDDQAVKAVQTWKFSPAKKDGQPVPVQINVEVNFKLYPH